MDIVAFVLQRNGFESLNPVQRAAVDAGLFSERNFVVASPTASGKTLIAEMAAVYTLSQGKKVVYTCPLRALASEHFNDFLRKYPEYKAALSVGDYDSADPWLKNYDIIFTTYEKLDSLLRHKAPWIPDVGLLIVDEIHEIDSERGPTVEMVVTRFLEMKKRVIALSATIPNAEEIAQWLDATLVVSQWRPVRLREGVFFAGVVYFSDGEEYFGGSDWKILVRDALDRGKQVLVFVSTRRMAERVAKSLIPLVSGYVRERKSLENGAVLILEALENPTAQCKALAECVRHGVAFHHAGLVHSQREVVETLFRQGALKVVVATPTLAAGVNLPAFRVVIHSIYRYTGAGQAKITVREYKQMVGRSGRPKYDDYGEGIVVVRSRGELETVMQRYVLGTPEDVTSRLGLEPVLRFHTLALTTEALLTKDALISFFEKTFFGFQFGAERLIQKIERVLSELESMGFLKIGDVITPTALGRRVAELYVDPLTAYNFVLFCQRPSFGEIPILYRIVDSSELYPYLPVRKVEEQGLWMHVYDLLPELPEDAMSDPFLLNKMKLLLVLKDWINEVPEDEILQNYDVSPGILRGKVEIASWLAYAFSEIARLLGERRVWDAAKKLERRLEHGVKEELLPLITIKYIGRVRARKLYNAGIRTPEDLRRAPLSKLAEILGEKTARKVLRELGQSDVKFY